MHYYFSFRSMFKMYEKWKVKTKVVVKSPAETAYEPLFLVHYSQAMFTFTKEIMTTQMLCIFLSSLSNCKVFLTALKFQISDSLNLPLLMKNMFFFKQSFLFSIFSNYFSFQKKVKFTHLTVIFSGIQYFNCMIKINGQSFMRLPFTPRSDYSMKIIVHYFVFNFPYSKVNFSILWLCMAASFMNTLS